MTILLNSTCRMDTHPELTFSQSR